MFRLVVVCWGFDWEERKINDLIVRKVMRDRAKRL